MTPGPGAKPPSLRRFYSKAPFPETREGARGAAGGSGGGRLTGERWFLGGGRGVQTRGLPSGAGGCLREGGFGGKVSHGGGLWRGGVPRKGALAGSCPADGGFGARAGGTPARGRASAASGEGLGAATGAHGPPRAHTGRRRRTRDAVGALGRPSAHMGRRRRTWAVAGAHGLSPAPVWRRRCSAGTRPTCWASPFVRARNVLHMPRMAMVSRRSWGDGGHGGGRWGSPLHRPRAPSRRRAAGPHPGSVVAARPCRRRLPATLGRAPAGQGPGAGSGAVDPGRPKARRTLPFQAATAAVVPAASAQSSRRGSTTKDGS